MSYIDNTKRDLYSRIYILEIENEMLRNQIRKLKIEENDKLLGDALNTKSNENYQENTNKEG